MAAQSAQRHCLWQLCVFISAAVIAGGAAAVLAAALVTTVLVGYRWAPCMACSSTCVGIPHHSVCVVAVAAAVAFWQ